MTRLLLLSVLLGACSFFDPSHHGGDDVCNKPQPTSGGGVAGIAAPAEQLRNPQDGTCQTFDLGGGGIPCDPECGPCPETAGVVAPPPNWPECVGPCDGLDEAGCTANPTCHATYGELATGDAAVDTFESCWDIAPNAPIAGGTCAGLDATTCAMHADCASEFDVTINPDDSRTLAFLDCITEPGSNPLDPGTCDTSQIHCNIGPPACPSGTVPGVKDGCWSGYCIPTADCPPTELACEQLATEAACDARSPECAASYTGMNCTCDGNGVCTCENETFDHCVTVGVL